MQVCLGKSLHDVARTESVFFCGCASNGQDSPKASPRVIFKRMLIERWRRHTMLSSMCPHADYWLEDLEVKEK